ncbi:MAG: hypothetical protein REH79_01610 [Spiroplasma sp.]|nr:hypothetical protein [Spiroplasma sp.]
MELIFTRKQIRQKKNIINNIQINLLYKLVADYLKLKAKDPNQEANKYITNKFDPLIDLLNLIDENLGRKISFAEIFDKEKNNLKLPLEFESMEEFLNVNPYFKSIFKSYLFLLAITFDEESQNICFLEIYRFFDKYKKEAVVTKKEVAKKRSLHKVINEVNKNYDIKDLNKCLNNSFNTSKQLNLS